MTNSTLKIFFIIFMAFSILNGCDETFDLPPSVYTGVDISYSDEDITSSPTVSAYGLGIDSLFVDSVITNKISVPLSINDSSTFIFTIDSIIDTLTIHHINTLKEESIESGFYYEYEITSVNYTINRIDSVAIPDSTVTSTWNENLYIYINNN